MRSLLATAVAVLSLVVLGGACAPAPRGGAESLAPETYTGRSDAPPTVRVTNHNWSNMTVYAVRGTTRFRLGMVTTMGTQVFKLPGALANGAGGVRLLADAIGGNEQFLAPPVQVSRGEEVKLELHNQLQISSVSVWGQR
jgi:FtsP/CotA-like multicopper oxidase with cupredoxin domain